MATPKLKANIRKDFGRSESKKLRNQGFVPGVIYGHNEETRAIKIDSIEFEKLLSKYGHGGTVTVELDGETVPAIIKEIQRDIVKDHLLHVDLQQLSENEKIRIHIPIVLHGREKVETKTTILQHQLGEIEIQCLPKDIPQSVAANVSNLEFGNSLTVADLDIVKNENIEVMNELSEVVASLTTAKMEEEDETETTEDVIFDSEKSILEEEEE